MCGLLAYRDRGDNSRIRTRGPDATQTLVRAPFTFVHNLLSVTGEFSVQPFENRDVVCLYNGEIYNHPFIRTDGEVLIPLYRQLGPYFARALDGEFAVALYDFAQEIAIFSTDPFKTKPLFINGAECASYRSGVGGAPAQPNEIVVVRFDGKVLDRAPVREWDLTQWKVGYDDWLAAFDRSIAKRAKPGCFLGLSSGYDSGAIACALRAHGTDFKAFTFVGDEHIDVLQARLSLVPHQFFEPDWELLPWLRQNLDNEPYTIVSNGKTVSTHVLDDGATLGIATIAKLARAEGRRVMLSGQGADEILSDYAPWPDQSELKGVFPEPLRLWRNFNHGCQESYLIKEEYAAGAFGIENRYPFLDAEVVQEFLSLSADAKNRYYKAPLREYLVRHEFPFEEGAKRGFRIDASSLT